MNNLFLGFLLTVLAGFSTMIGASFIFLKSKNKQKIIISSLAFASGVMSTVSLTDLSYESFNLLKGYFFKTPCLLIILIFITIGIILSMLIDKYIPDINITEKDKSLYKVGLISMIAIILHNIPEGIATFLATTQDIKLGISLTIAIAMHNIPEGISIAIPIFYSTKDKKKALKFTLISAISEPIGAIIAFIFLKNIVNDFIMGIIFSIIAGIMLHISFYELLPSSLSYKHKYRTIIYYFLGIGFILAKFFFKIG
ncbi:MAG: ZIP family metal transporter [bacterium]|nr:ZIP family metal transporter [bacterium]